jgi:Zn-dependent oligopeptidase
VLCILDPQFMEMWLQNDGFVHRLAQLSHNDTTLDDDTINVLRNALKNDKALEIVNTIFLSVLQFAVFDEFDPRGDETLMALQARLAKEYLPKGNLPEASDLSPLLAVFQEQCAEQSMSAYGSLWSELLSAMVYESFRKTDLRDRNEVDRLGKGIRDLFLRPPGSKAVTLEELMTLCPNQPAEITGQQLKRVYRFDRKDDEGSSNESTNQAEVKAT